MSDRKYRNIMELIDKFDSKDHVQRDRGTLFELMIITYLKHEPMYYRLFEEVWSLNQVPEEYNIPKVDTGVDLVAKKRDSDELVAIQCKFYSADTTIQKSHIDSFLNEVGKSYYAEGMIVTSTNKWSKNAESSLNQRDKSIMRVSLSDLQDSEVDWDSFSPSTPDQVSLHERKEPRRHQEPAIQAVVDGFEEKDRGKLIMAPGTGKTYTSMKIAEEMANEKEGTFKVLYLVPSIQLLSQTLRSWNADIDPSYEMESIAVCSDRKVTKGDSTNDIEDISTADIGFPATTNNERLVAYQAFIDGKGKPTDFIGVFSTYQSIDVIIEAQKNGFYDFDLIICDEAHRTTGATELNKESSAFTKVHSNSNVQAAKRLYQTATPRVYGEDAKQKAAEKSVVIADMNDPEVYGEEFYRIGFGDAIRQDILTDYKVMVLAVDEEVVARRFQNMLANEQELEFDDVTKIIGCWNGLVKRNGNTNQTLGNPMKRAIAFTGTIKESKKITNMFSHVVDEYLQNSSENASQFSIDVEHADGSMNAMEKNEKINWLKSEVPDNTCRVLSNARFLTEGVDVPDLDAIMFLKPRKSKIDIAQAVGRVMRKASDKEYGYIILPVGIPAGQEPHEALDHNEKYQVVWEVLNALRSLDERFDATINKLELNNKKPGKLRAIGVGDAPEDIETPTEEQIAWELDEEELNDLERALYGKVVEKVGNVRYWEHWSEDVAEIARKHIMRIKVMLEDKDSNTYSEFRKFMRSLHHNINDSISEHQAIEMLSQHLITKPIFEALFDSYSFVNNNPVSQSMEAILNVLDKQGLMKEQEKLEGFYESVRIRAEGIDNLESKQKIIIQLYDRFFKVGFKETTDRLGIVFTPVEIVDFIIHSVDCVLKEHFGKSIKDEGVHVLDPFTGTGTFIVRLLQSGLISKEDLLRKYTQEIHANEIILLSYYIAAINIEETFHAVYEGEYTPFEGIVLTDTFESTEKQDSFMDELFNANNERLKKQQDQPIFAILGNPPYSVGQQSENDNNQNIKYPELDKRIEETYVKHSRATNRNSLYDSYIRAIRWASEQIEENGVIGFVTNGSFIDSLSSDGLRKSLAEEFNYIYIYNLRGNQRTSGEISRKEGGKIFGGGSRTPVAITLLVKNFEKNFESQGCEIFYKDIGDYLHRDEKLKIIRSDESFHNIKDSLIKIEPDKYHNWINQQNEEFDLFLPLAEETNAIFNVRDLGIKTNKDAWVVNFSKEELTKNVKKLIKNYNEEVDRYKKELIKNPNININDFINNDNKYIKWSRKLKTSLRNHIYLEYKPENIIEYMYRPFAKRWAYYQKYIVEEPRKYKKLFGENLHQNNLLINTSGRGTNKAFSSLITKQGVDSGFLGANVFPEYLFTKKNEDSLFDSELESIKELNINKNVVKLFEDVYDFEISHKDIIYYVYGVFHSKEYRETYGSDLRKVFPRIPLVQDFKKFAEAGRILAELHTNYEEVPPYKVTENIDDNPEKVSFKVNKMKFGKDKNRKTDKSVIIYNESISISKIPLEAYDYMVDGRSAIEWVMDQYQVRVDKLSGITNDPNNYSPNPRYILDLLKRIIYISIETNKIITNLPRLQVINEVEIN